MEPNMKANKNKKPATPKFNGLPSQTATPVGQNAVPSSLSTPVSVKQDKKAKAGSAAKTPKANKNNTLKPVVDLSASKGITTIRIYTK